MTQVTSARLGESLGTDFFSVREQFTDEQWEHFITVRRFVDEEVVPVVGPYWERAEICWPLVKRLPELGIVGEDITCRRSSSAAPSPASEPSRRTTGVQVLRRGLRPFSASTSPASRRRRRFSACSTSSSARGITSATRDETAGLDETPAQARVPPGRDGDRGQLLPAQRRRGRGRGDERP
jgi:hypothetical protein